MEIQHLSPEMLPALSDFANSAFHLDAGKFSPDTFRWHLFNDSHVRPEYCVVLTEGDAIVGCALGVARGVHAWIKLFGMSPDCRRKGMATRMFERLENTFAQAGVRRIHIGNCVPLYFMPGVDPRYTEAVCFLEARGYRRNSDAVNMVVPLEGEDFDTSEDEARFAEDGIIISRIAPDQADAFGEWMMELWSEGWQEEALLSLKHDPVTTFVALKDGEFCGFVTHDVELFGSSLGPMGVSPEARNKGLGGALVRRCLQSMKERGDAFCEIAWVGPVAFYARVANARIHSVFFHFTKSLDY